MAQKGHLSTCSAMTFKIRRHDVTSIEHNVDQSCRLFICDVASKHLSCGQMYLLANEDSCSKRVHKREDICKCKYLHLYRLIYKKVLDHDPGESLNTYV